MVESVSSIAVMGFDSTHMGFRSLKYHVPMIVDTLTWIYVIIDCNLQLSKREAVGGQPLIASASASGVYRRTRTHVYKLSTRKMAALDGTLLKMERDYSDEIDEQLPRCKELAAVRT